MCHSWRPVTSRVVQGPTLSDSYEGGTGHLHQKAMHLGVGLPFGVAWQKLYKIHLRQLQSPALEQKQAQAPAQAGG